MFAMDNRYPLLHTLFILSAQQGFYPNFRAKQNYGEVVKKLKQSGFLLPTIFSTLKKISHNTSCIGLTGYVRNMLFVCVSVCMYVCVTLYACMYVCTNLKGKRKKKKVGVQTHTQMLAERILYPADVCRVNK